MCISASFGFVIFFLFPVSDISRTGIRHREVVHILKSWPSLPLYAKDVVKILSRICCWALSVQELVPGKKKKKKEKKIAAASSQKLNDNSSRPSPKVHRVRGFLLSRLCESRVHGGCAKARALAESPYLSCREGEKCPTKPPYDAGLSISLSSTPYIRSILHMSDARTPAGDFSTASTIEALTKRVSTAISSNGEVIDSSCPT